jgi:hypothetical protein
MAAPPLRRTLPALALVAAPLAALAAAAVALAAPPQELAQPTLEGTPRRGSLLLVHNGRWGNSPTSFAYRWHRCDANGANCVRIAGQTAQRYRLVAADVGRTVVGIVLARNGEGTVAANSKPSPVVADLVVPQSLQAPTIEGPAVVGGTLNASPGVWTGAPDAYGYFWLQCDAAGANCVDTGARGRTYGVRQVDTGRTIRVQVQARNPRGRADAVSVQTRVVEAGGTGPGPAVPVSSVTLPDRLVISHVTFSPAAIPNRRRLITLRVQVRDTRNRLVSGAPVLATGIPFGRVTPTPETVTNATGVATITFRATRRLAMRRGASVVFFLRARKPGENPLAGVATRRLVQVTVRPG